MSGTYPEHDRMLAVKARSQPIGEFLDWLQTQDIHLAVYVKTGWDGDALVPYHVPIESLLARYFEIDLDVIEAEKMQLLADVRAMNLRITS